MHARYGRRWSLTAFVCCPSNDMLMTYYPASHTIVGELALRWTSTFLYRLAKLGQTSSRSSVPLSPLTRDTQWNRDTLVGKHAPSGSRHHRSIQHGLHLPTPHHRAGGATGGDRVQSARPYCDLLACRQCGAGEALVPAPLSRSPHRSLNGPSSEEAGKMDELSYLSSLSLPVMEPPPETQLATQADLNALTALPPTWASSRVRFYHAKSLLQRAYSDDAALPQSWIGHDLPARPLPSASSSLLPGCRADAVGSSALVQRPSGARPGDHHSDNYTGRARGDLVRPGSFSTAAALHRSELCEGRSVGPCSRSTISSGPNCFSGSSWSEARSGLGSTSPPHASLSARQSPQDIIETYE